MKASPTFNETSCDVGSRQLKTSKSQPRPCSWHRQRTPIKPFTVNIHPTSIMSLWCRCHMFPFSRPDLAFETERNLSLWTVTGCLLTAQAGSCFFAARRRLIELWPPLIPWPRRRILQKSSADLPPHTAAVLSFSAQHNFVLNEHFYSLHSQQHKLIIHNNKSTFLFRAIMQYN